MTTDLSPHRAAFAEQPHLWIVVRHFLSASMLHELCDVLVHRVSRGEVPLSELFDSILGAGQPALANWALLPKECSSSPLTHHLQAFVRTIAWQGDAMPPGGADGLDEPAKGHLTELLYALELSALDGPEVKSGRALGEPPTSLEPLARAIAVVASLTGEEKSPASLIAQRAIDGLQPPLSALVVKHLGDIAADLDNWRIAAALYEHAGEVLRASEDPDWAEFTAALGTIIGQSSAAAVTMLVGPGPGAARLAPLIEEEHPATNPLPFVNVPLDAMNMQISGGDIFGGRDNRAALVLAPQLLPAHQISRAMDRWAHGKYGDAARWFWAVLRRQTALGSWTESRSTKALYSNALLDHLTSVLARTRSEEDFGLAVRLLVEAGDADFADNLEWSRDLVSAYVDVAAVNGAILLLGRAPGMLRQRTMVLVQIFKRWTLLLPRRQLETARIMLSFMVSRVRENAPTPPGSRSASTVALKALKEIGRAQPDFRVLVANDLADLLLAAFSRAHHLALSDAMEAIEPFLDAFDADRLRSVTSLLAGLLSADGAAQYSWPILRPALAILHSGAVRRICDEDPAIAELVTKAELHVALEGDSEAEGLLYLIRRLDPLNLETFVSAERLGEIVQGIRKRALQINSSAAGDSILALLVAPAASGPEGVADALHGLEALLKSASEHRTALSFGTAYHALILLSDAREEIGRRVADEHSVERKAVEPIWEALLQVWKVAPARPEIFNGFSFHAPSAPNSTMVHNWTFASMKLAQVLRREEELRPLLRKALENAELASPMSVAMAISQGDMNSSDPHLASMDDEQAEGFYAALGHRLVVLAKSAPADRPPIASALLAKAFEHGPHGMDAAIFSAAIESGLRCSPAPQDAVAYRKRLASENALRISLAPLYHALTAADVDDA